MSNNEEDTTNDVVVICNRLAFRGDQLQLLGGRLYVRATRLLLGRAPKSLNPDELTTLTITSSELTLEQDDLVSACSGPCGRHFPVHHMGLRKMGDGSLRNQPQCPECRARYGKHRTTNDSKSERRNHFKAEKAVAA
jgi:hypothetical protein